MSKCCVICVGRNADRAADRIEAYAKKSDKDVVKGIMELAAEHGISINDESRGYEPALISFEENNA